MNGDESEKWRITLFLMLRGMEKCYGLQPDDRLFPYNKSFLYREMQYGIDASGVKRIRVHDIRHSHASLLVELGFSPLLIAERLGHERVQTTIPMKQSSAESSLKRCRIFLTKPPSEPRHGR